MGYQERFTKEEIVDFENRLLELMGKARTDFSEPLWENGNFVFNALPYLDYKHGFWVVEEFISEKLYDKMLIVCHLIENLRAAHNYIFVSGVLRRVPASAWADETFLHNVVCADITAIEYIPDEFKTAGVIMNAIYQVPKQEDFYEECYAGRYIDIIGWVPVCLWEDGDFVEGLKKEFTKVYGYIQREKDLERVLAAVDKKLGL